MIAPPAKSKANRQTKNEATRVETGEFTPPSRTDLLFARSMAGARPYIFLQDTNFDTWTMEYTDQYFQICLVCNLCYLQYLGMLD